MTELVYRQKLRQAALIREEFVREFNCREIRFSDYNFSRLLNLTGERPARIAEMRRILGDLGPWDVFDHGKFWARDGKPWAIVGHPYEVNADRRAMLAELARFTTLRVSVDDRPSHYGFGTHHVRVELARPRKPFGSLRPTRATRAYARRARAVIEAEFDGSAIA